MQASEANPRASEPQRLLPTPGAVRASNKYKQTNQFVFIPSKFQPEGCN